MDDDHESWHVLLVAGMGLLSVGLWVQGHLPWYVEYTALLGAIAFSLAAVYRSQSEAAPAEG